MLPLEGHDLLRVALFSALAGFATFCISYVFFVWRRRNAPRQSRPSRLAQVARTSVTVGGIGLVTCWAMNEFQGRDGIARGSDVFVVPARRGTVIQDVTLASTIQKGDVIAEFMSPADRTRLLGVQVQQAQAIAKRDAINSRALQLEESLLQEQSHLRSKLLQLKASAFELRKSRYEIERERTVLRTAWMREENQIMSDLGVTQKERLTAAGHLEVAQKGLERTEELHKKNFAPTQLLDKRRLEQFSAQLGVRKQEEMIDSLRDRRRLLQERFGRSDRSFAEQISNLERDYTSIETEMTGLQLALKGLEQKLAADRERALLSRDRETKAAEYDIAILGAEKSRLTEATLIRSPFAGKIVYRHEAPSLAPEGAPILALSAGTGFTSEIRLPTSEVDELASANGDVQLALEDPVLHRFFTGRFVRAEPIAFEPDRVIAYIESSLPGEVIAALGTATNPLRVRLLWRPPLRDQPAFVLSLLLLTPVVFVFNRTRRTLIAEPERVSSRLSDQFMIEVGSEELVLFSLAARFQEQLRVGRLDPELLLDLELILHQNGTWAARILSREIQPDQDLRWAAKQYLQQQDEHTRHRLEGLLRMISPTILERAE
jgi:multidrug resistance efflux pump